MKESWRSRLFVMAPLMNVLGSSVDSDTVARWHDLSVHPGGIFGPWKKLSGESPMERKY